VALSGRNHFNVFLESTKLLVVTLQRDESLKRDAIERLSATDLITKLVSELTLETLIRRD
jgi:hypothetical protein